MIVHFICRGNVLRSLIAETYLKSLNLPNVIVRSSGTGTDYFSEGDLPFFVKTVDVLDKHGLKKYTKAKPEQLTQQRLDDNDVTILMNERVYSDASKIVNLPTNTIVWDIVDIGEGTRTGTHENNREIEEVIYDEVAAKVDELVKSLNSGSDFQPH